MTGWQFADVWDAVASVHGDRSALVHGDRRVSWQDLKARANALATALVARQPISRDSDGRAPSGKAGYAGTRQRILVPLQSVSSAPIPP